MSTELTKMSRLLMSSEERDRFRDLCLLLRERGRGRTLGDMGAAHDLAVEMEKEKWDPELLKSLKDQLGLSDFDLQGLGKGA